MLALCLAAAACALTMRGDPWQKSDPKATVIFPQLLHSRPPRGKLFTEVMDRMDLAHRSIPMFTMFISIYLGIELGFDWGMWPMTRWQPFASAVHGRFGIWQACTKQPRGFVQRKIHLSFCVRSLYLWTTPHLAYRLSFLILCIIVSVEQLVQTETARMARLFQYWTLVALWESVSAHLHFEKNIRLSKPSLGIQLLWTSKGSPVAKATQFQLHSYEPCAMFNDQELRNYIYLVIIIPCSQHMPTLKLVIPIVSWWFFGTPNATALYFEDGHHWIQWLHWVLTATIGFADYSRVNTRTIKWTLVNSIGSYLHHWPYQTIGALSGATPAVEVAQALGAYHLWQLQGFSLVSQLSLGHWGGMKWWYGEVGLTMKNGWWLLTNNGK